jgi:hypothetical protein
VATVALALLVIGALIFSDFIFGAKLLLYKDIGADSTNDTYPTFILLSDYIRAHGLPSWSFSVGMGQSVYYLVGDLILEPVVRLGRHLIAPALVYLHLAKAIVAGLLFWQFLRLRGNCFAASTAGALGLAFSAHMCMGSCWIISADDTLCFTFLLFATELAIISGYWVLVPNRLRADIDHKIDAGDPAPLILARSKTDSTEQYLVADSELSIPVGPVSAHTFGFYGSWSDNGFGSRASLEARWNSFNVGEALFPESRWSLLPLLLIVGLGVWQIARIAFVSDART